MEPALVRADGPPRHRALGRLQPQPGGASPRSRPGRESGATVPPVADPRLRRPAHRIGRRALAGSDLERSAEPVDDERERVLPRADRRADADLIDTPPTRRIAIAE